MTNDSALSHLVDPGEYLCTWVFKGASKTSKVRVPGSITLEGSRVPHGHGYGYAASEIPRILDYTPALTSFPRSWTLPTLRADLATGTSVMLLNVTVTVWAPERVRITAAAALAGCSSPSTNLAAVCEVDVQVTRLDVIAAAAPLRREIRFPRDDGMVLYGVAPGQRAEVAWEDASANLTMSYVSKAAPADLYRHYHVFSPLLKIELDEPLAFLEFSTVWLDPIRNLTSVATSAAESITWVTATGESENGDDGTWQVFAQGITQQPYASSEGDIVSTTAALALGPDGDDLLAVLRKWISLDNDLHPVLHTFGREIRGLSDQSPRGRFLTLMQAIEGTHQREDAGQIAVKQAEHTKQRNAIMSRAVADSWTA